MNRDAIAVSKRCGSQTRAPKKAGFNFVSIRVHSWFNPVHRTPAREKVS
jgi:hypothetical protein